MTDARGLDATGAGHGAEKAALQSRVRPSLVLEERLARDLLSAAKSLDVASGGRFSAGPAGVQVWSGPFDGPGSTRGTSVHLGSVDWTYDTPARGYCTIYRAMVTETGLSRGESPDTVLRTVLDLIGATIEGPRIEQPMPPARDPFKR